MVLAAASGAYARQGRRDAYQIVELSKGTVVFFDTTLTVTT